MPLLVDTTKAPKPPDDPPVSFDKAAAAEQLRERVRQAITDQIEQFTPEKIVESIVAQVRKAEREITWKILGMDNRWGREWEIDHCNGRISPLSTELATRCQPLLSDAICEIGREVVAEMTVDPKARETLKKAFKKDLQGYLDRTLRDTARDRASEIARATVDGIVAEVKVEAGL